MSHRRNDPTKADLQRLFDLPPVPEDLCAHIERNIEADTRGERRRWHWTGLAGAAAAGLLMTLRFSADAPALIADIYGHARHEMTVAGRLDAQFETWSEAHQIFTDALKDAQLLKHCRVDGVSMRHVRIAADVGGEINLFLAPAGTAADQSGRIEGQRWRAVTLGPDIQLVALYPDGGEGEVDRLVQAIRGRDGVAG